MLNRREPQLEESAWDKFLFNMVYLFAAGVAAYHSAVVFLMSDPWYVAVPAALVVDGLTAYSVSMLGRWRNSQRNAGFIGIALFVIISASAQIIARYEGAGVAVPAALRWVSLALVPLSSTGAVVALGAIKFFGNNRQSSATTPIAHENSVGYAPQLGTVKISQSTLEEIGGNNFPSDAKELGNRLAEPAPGGADGIFAPIVELVKRKPGRPKKVAYAKDVKSDLPKL